AQDPAHALAGASAQVLNVTCSLTTAGGLVTPVAAGSFSCLAVLNPGDQLSISATVTLNAFDEGKFGAVSPFKGFAPLPGTGGFAPVNYPPILIPDGFE